MTIIIPRADTCNISANLANAWQETIKHSSISRILPSFVACWQFVFWRGVNMYGESRWLWSKTAHLVVEIRFVLEKGQGTAQQHECYHACAPKIGFLSVAGTGQDLTPKYMNFVAAAVADSSFRERIHGMGTCTQQDDIINDS